MNFLNTATTQLRDMLQSMNSGTRILAGLLLTVVFVSFAFLFQQHSVKPDVYLFGGEYLPTSQLDRIEAAIAKRGLSGQYREGNRIRVPSKTKHEYLAAVAEEGALPRNFHDLMGNSLKEGGIWESRNRTRQRLQIAKTETLSEIVRAMKWVEDAVVLYDEQPASGWNRPKQVTGSVNVQPLPGESVTQRRKESLQRLVAHSVIGLTPEKVAVTSLGDDSSYGSSGISAEVFHDVYLRERANFNEHQRTAILQELDYIPGIRVQVNAELENGLASPPRAKKPHLKNVVVGSVHVGGSFEEITAEEEGSSGLKAQGPVPQQKPLTVKANRNQTITTTRKEEGVIGFTTQRARKSGYVPTRVWATIAVPRDYLLQVWRTRSSTPTTRNFGEPNQQELNTLAKEQKRIIENLVAPLLPRPIEEPSTKYVTVEFVDSVTASPSPAPLLANTVLSWMDRHWKFLSVVGLAMLSLLILRSITSVYLHNKDSIVAKQENTMGDNSNNSVNPSPETNQDRNSTPAPHWKTESFVADDLVEIVHEDPDAAATILREWIGKAA